MRILKLPAKILYYVSDEFNKICKNVFLCVSIQIAARISTGKSDMAIAHCWILDTHGPSSVRRPFTISNVFSSETAWPIKAKFYVEPPWQGGKFI